MTRLILEWASRRRGIPIACIPLLLACVGAAAVPQESGRLEFDVASVKPFRGDSAGLTGGFCHGGDTAFSLATPFGAVASRGAAGVSPNTCRFRRTSLRYIIAAAFGLPRSDFRSLIVGGPGWLDTELWDIEAKTGSERSEAELEQMLQRLLQDRFGLRLSRVQRDIDRYVVGIVDGGHKLKEASTGTTSSFLMRPGGSITASATPLAKLISSLTLLLGETVVDETNLRGSYDFAMTWTPTEAEMPGLPPALLRVAPGADAPTDPGVSLFTALKEQLGLSLRRKKIATEIIVVEAVDRASPN